MNTGDGKTSDSAENAGIGIGEYASLSTNLKWYLAASQLAQLALTDVTNLNSILLWHSKTVHRMLGFVATGKLTLQ